MFQSATHKRLAVVLALAAVFVSGCGSDRPSVDDWQTTWDRISSSIPDEASIPTDDPQSVCSETLVFLRSNRPELFPTPDLAIDNVVTAWIEIAESSFFECPPNNDQVSDFAAAYAEMRRLEAEIELVLDIDRSE